jgi:hypothetical protein
MTVVPSSIPDGGLTLGRVSGEALLGHSERRHRARHPDPDRPSGERPMPQPEQLADDTREQDDDRRRRAEESDNRAVLVHRQGLLHEGAPTGGAESRAQEAGALPRQQDRQLERGALHRSEERRGRRRHILKEEQEGPHAVTKKRVGEG